MNRDELLNFLVSLFPDFKEDWKSEDNDYKDNGDFSVHGLCSEFSSYFVEHAEHLTDNQMIMLFAAVESIVSSDANDMNPTANALCTCFLENIACTASGDLAAKHMGCASRHYYDAWNNC